MDMPIKKRCTAAAQAAARWPLPEVPAELLDHLVKGPMTPSEVQDLFLSFQKAVIERTMAAEVNLHLGYRPTEFRTRQDEFIGLAHCTVPRII